MALKPGHAEAALFLELRARRARTNAGLTITIRSLALAPDGQIDDEHAQRDADLRRRQPDAGRRVHRLDHVVDQPLQGVVEGRDLGAGSCSEALAVAQDRPDHRRG